MKYQINYHRKVQTPIQYEMMSIGYTIEADRDVMSPEVAYKTAVDFVESKLAERLYELEQETKR